MGQTPHPTDAAASPLLDERSLSKLHWRCRRGLLENDLFIKEFFARYEFQLTERHANALLALMDLGDHDLLDLLLRRKEPQDTLDTADVREILTMLRPEVAQARSSPDDAATP
ncbi:MAG: succinate dehydrogenase assembly factor 2 [Giesbergeria sp.]|nr:succinate dehydrogenase assembly factor 2 [Giesbergeria sp.]